MYQTTKISYKQFSKVTYPKSAGDSKVNSTTAQSQNSGPKLNNSASTPSTDGAKQNSSVLSWTDGLKRELNEFAKARDETFSRVVASYDLLTEVSNKAKAVYSTVEASRSEQVSVSRKLDNLLSKLRANKKTDYTAWLTGIVFLLLCNLLVTALLYSNLVK